ncbi:MAG: IS1634 family transposase [Pseudanabaena sp. ELA748]
MAQPRHYSSQLIDHLGLVAGMYDELGIGEQIDRLILQDSDKRTVSIGQAVKAMVLNGLGFANRALYLTPLFFRDKPVDRLIGAGITADHLNDDVLGRTLDALYAYGLEAVYQQVSILAVNRLGLGCRFVHMDSTSFHTDGQYNSKEEPDEGVIHITQGYSRDHRPDLNQVVLQLICERQAGIPLLMQPLSGNNSDKVSFRDMIKTHSQQLRTDFGTEYLVADSALYTAETLKELAASGWISRVPETLTLACAVIDAVAPDLMADLAQKSLRSVCTNYGDVKQRWLVVYSPEAHQRAQKTVDKQCVKQSRAELQTFEKLCLQDFACEADARKALSAFEKKLNMTFVSNATIKALPRFNGKGRPAQDRKPDFYLYRLEGALASMPQERVRRLQRKSCFILATNQLNEELLSNDQLLAAYKDQQKVERGFRFLKDPLFMAASLFLKSPQRIMALMMIMTLCLLVYAALEHRIRDALKTNHHVFPDQKGKAITNPTTRWVFQFFGGIHLLAINQVQTLVLNLNAHHLSLLKLLGKQYEEIYSASG